MDSISLYRNPRTGTQYIGNWASRCVLVYGGFHESCMILSSFEGAYGCRGVSDWGLGFDKFMKSDTKIEA